MSSVAHQTLLFKQVFHSEELLLKTRCYLFLVPKVILPTTKKHEKHDLTSDFHLHKSRITSELSPFSGENNPQLSPFSGEKV
jgi:hypothetical protein